jgi:beta-lactamase superfamily II metal-dependent hydrolase
MLLITKFARYFFGILCIFLFSTGQCLEMMICAVGQSNFIILKHNDKALVVDCGHHLFHRNYADWNTTSASASRGNAVSKFLAGVTVVNIVITHNHYDHYSLSPFFYSPLNTPKKIFASLYPKDTPSRLPTATEVNVINDIKEIYNALGNDVTIYPVLPNKWPFLHSTPPGSRSTDRNDNSLVLVVEYGIDRILLTGDASGHTLDAIKAGGSHSDKLENITCMILPHHGSNNNREFEWVKHIHKISNDKLVLLVSSDPTQNNKIPDDKIKALFSLFKETAEKHCFSTSTIFSSTIEYPFFLTSNSKCGFFKLVFNQSGIAAVYDGDIPINLIK